MITLIGELYDIYFGRPRYNILITGIDNAGKTKLLNACKRLSGKDNPDDRKIISTTGLNIATYNTNNTRLRFWDLGGKRQLRKLWSHYYQESHALIYVVRLKDLKTREDEILFCLELLLKEQNLLGIPLMVALNEDARMEIPEKTEFIRKLGQLLKDKTYKIVQVKLPNSRWLSQGISWLEQQMLLISRNLGLL